MCSALPDLIDAPAAGRVDLLASLDKPRFFARIPIVALARLDVGLDARPPPAGESLWRTLEGVGAVSPVVGGRPRRRDELYRGGICVIAAGDRVVVVGTVGNFIVNGSPAALTAHLLAEPRPEVEPASVAAAAGWAPLLVAAALSEPVRPVAPTCQFVRLDARPAAKPVSVANKQRPPVLC